MIGTFGIITGFLLGMLIVIALAYMFRDLASGRYHQVDRRLKLNADANEIANYYREQNFHTGRFDQWFYQLVNQSGSNFDVPSALTLILGCTLVGGALQFVILENLLAVALGALIGMVLPIAWLSYLRWRRVGTMRNQLPEALQLVADEVRAGHSLEQSAESVASGLHGPLSTEFGQCASQLRFGNSSVSVMEQMSQRIPLPEFRVFATAVMVHQTAGGNLALLTERLARSARDRQEFYGHVKSVTAGSRFSASAIVVVLVFGLAYMWFFSPEYLEAFTTHASGPFWLVASLALQVTGIILIWRMSRLNY